MAAPPVAPREAVPSTLSAPLVDTHVHLTDRRYARDLEDVMERAADARVAAMVVVGYDVASSEGAVRLSERFPHVWAAVGMHPHNAKDASPAVLRDIEGLASAPRVVAVGECGLDFYRNLSPVAEQHAALLAQLDLAARRRLPVVIHCRDAMPEMLRVIEEHRPASGGVMHCFDGTAADALKTVELGLYVSCAGPLTYRKDQTLAQAIAAVPADRLVIETDCPYLSPEGHRGERNEPAYVRTVAETVARVRGVRFEQMAHQTTVNALRLFSLPAPEAMRELTEGAIA
jgi:TatD DNase family protein